MIKTWWGTMLEYIGAVMLGASIAFSLFYFESWWGTIAGLLVGPAAATILFYDVPTRWKGWTHRRGWWVPWDADAPNGGIELATPLEMPDGSPLHPTPCTVHVHGVSEGYLEPRLDRHDPKGKYCRSQAEIEAYVYGRIKGWMSEEPVAFALYKNEMTWYVETPEEHEIQIWIRKEKDAWERNFRSKRRISPRTYDRYRKMGLRYPSSLVDWGSPEP